MINTVNNSNRSLGTSYTIDDLMKTIKTGEWRNDPSAKIDTSKDEFVRIDRMIDADFIPEPQPIGISSKLIDDFAKNKSATIEISSAGRNQLNRAVSSETSESFKIVNAVNLQSTTRRSNVNSLVDSSRILKQYTDTSQQDAKDMIKDLKKGMLNQAQTTMLAQANQSPDSVLKLLR